MIRYEVVRFSLSQVIAWVKIDLQKNAVSITDALNHYLAWGSRRGWRVVSVIGSFSPDARTIVAVERDNQRQYEMKIDEQWAVVWASEDPKGEVSFLPDLDRKGKEGLSVEVVPGRQPPWFASERPEKRGLK